VNKIESCSERTGDFDTATWAETRGTGGTVPQKFEVGDGPMGPCIRPPIFEEVVLYGGLLLRIVAYRDISYIYNFYLYERPDPDFETSFGSILQAVLFGEHNY